MPHQQRTARRERTYEFVFDAHCKLTPTQKASIDLKSIDPQKDSTLMHIPWEMRFHIYQILLTLPNGEYSARTNDIASQEYQDRHRSHTLSLLQTCKMTFQEAEPIFYTVNRCRFVNSAGERSSAPFLIGIGPSRCQAITSIVLEEMALGTLGEHLNLSWQSLTNLRTITIERTILWSAVSLFQGADSTHTQMRVAFASLPRLREIVVRTRFLRRLPQDIEETFEMLFKIDAKITDIWNDGSESEVFDEWQWTVTRRQRIMLT